LILSLSGVVPTVPGQFGAGHFGATIRLGQFGARYDIKFVESSVFIQQYFFHQSRFYFSNNFSLIPHPFQQYSFHQSRLVLNIMS